MILTGIKPHLLYVFAAHVKKMNIVQSCFGIALSALFVSNVMAENTSLLCTWIDGTKDSWKQHRNGQAETSFGKVETPAIRQFHVNFSERVCDLAYVESSGGMELQIVSITEMKIVCETESFARQPPITKDSYRRWVVSFDRYSGNALRKYDFVDLTGALVKQTLSESNRYSCEVKSKMF